MKNEKGIYNAGKFIMENSGSSIEMEEDDTREVDQDE